MARQCHRLPICFSTSDLTNSLTIRNKNQGTLIVRRAGLSTCSEVIVLLPADSTFGTFDTSTSPFCDDWSRIRQRRIIFTGSQVGCGLLGLYLSCGGLFLVRVARHPERVSDHFFCLFPSWPLSLLLKEMPEQ